LSATSEATSSQVLASEHQLAGSNDLVAIRENGEPSSSTGREPAPAANPRAKRQTAPEDEITMDTENETGPHQASTGRKVRDKTLDSYASMAAAKQKPAVQNKGSTPIPANAGVSNGAKGPGAAGKTFARHSNSLSDGKFSSTAIPRDRKYNPQGWVQAEFSDRQLSSDRSRTKEDIKNLERAWQLRIDLDEHRADELEKKLLSCQEIVGAFAANMTITSRELRQNFQLLEPLKIMSQEAFDTKERCTSELRKMSDVYAQRSREDTFEDFKSLANNDDVRRLRSGADIDQYVNQIETELETSLAGSDARFLMLKDKPNISAGGLRKVTNDSSALLRAEKDAIRKVQELRKVAPAVEKRHEDKVALDQQRQKLEHERKQAQEKLKAITMERQKIRDRVAELKQIEERQRRDFEALDKERNDLRTEVSNLRLEIRAELAERNKQRERYRFVLAQEEELLLRHKLRQDEIAGADEAELRNQLEAVESARLAKEEAEAHARMLQSTIARFERLKGEVEGFLHTSSEKGENGNDFASSWQSFGNVTDSNDQAVASDQIDEGERIGIPRNGWREPNQDRGNDKSSVLTSNLSNGSDRISSHGFSKVREIGNATPLTLPTVDESETFKDVAEGDNDQLYRQAYNSQIYTPSMGDRVREERVTNSEFLENDESTPSFKSAIPVFKALNFTSIVTSVGPDEVPLAPEFQDELKATMERLFEIKQAQEEKSKPNQKIPKAAAKQRVLKVSEKEESDDSADESIAPLGKVDFAFEAYQKEVSQDINIAEIREKERRLRELRAARRLNMSASQDVEKKKLEAPKVKTILSTLFTAGITSVPVENQPSTDAAEESHVKAKSNLVSRSSKRGKKRRKGTKRAHGDSDDDSESDKEESALIAQAEARKLALAKVKRKEADRRFWRTVAFYAALAILGAVFSYALYESMSVPVGGRSKTMSPGQRSRMMSSNAYQYQDPSASEESGGVQEEFGDSKAKREPLIQVQIQGQDQKPFPEPLKVYHGLGDPEGVRNDVRAFVRKYGIVPEAEQHLYKSVIEQLQNRVRGQIPTPGEQFPPGSGVQESEDNEDDGEDTNNEDEEEASDPEEDEPSQENRDHWYEDEDEDERQETSSRKRSGRPVPLPVPESPAAASGSQGWKKEESKRPSSAGSKKGPSSAPQMPRSTPQMPRGAGAFDRSGGAKAPAAEKDPGSSRKPEVELKIKAASGEYLPPFPVFADSTQDSLIEQVSLVFL
jgi:hypothetical protein